MLALFAEVGVTPKPLPSNLRTEYFRAGEQGETNDAVFFGHLGLEVVALDYSDFEGAEIVADLNRELDARLHGQFGLVVDGGTTEHVFNVFQSLSSCVKLLRPGGQVVHMSPINNYVNHGFYQLNPTAFHDFYEANNFTDIVSDLAVHKRVNPANSPWFMIPYDHNRFYGIDGCSSYVNDTNSCMIIFFRGRKSHQSTGNEIPIQKFYREVYAQRYQRQGCNVITYEDEGVSCILSNI